MKPVLKGQVTFHNVINNHAPKIIREESNLIVILRMEINQLRKLLLMISSNHLQYL